LREVATAGGGPSGKVVSGRGDFILAAGRRDDPPPATPSRARAATRTPHRRPAPKPPAQRGDREQGQAPPPERPSGDPNQVGRRAGRGCAPERDSQLETHRKSGDVRRSMKPLGKTARPSLNTEETRFRFTIEHAPTFHDSRKESPGPAIKTAANAQKHTPDQGEGLGILCWR